MTFKDHPKPTPPKLQSASSSNPAPASAVLSRIRQIEQKKLRKLNRAQGRPNDRYGVWEPPAARGRKKSVTEQAQGLAVPAPTTKAPRVLHLEQSLALKQWWDTEGRARFGTRVKFARDAGVGRNMVSRWFSGRCRPTGEHRQWLWKVTRLPCFDPKALERERDKAAEERRRKARAWEEKHHKHRCAQRRDRYRARQPHVNDDELERLRQRENRLEALGYGPEEKQVCLNCGLICNGVGVHVNTCPVKPESAVAYKADWGYNVTTALLSAKSRENVSRSRRESEKVQAAQEKLRPKFLEASAAYRKRQSEARSRGIPLRRGPMRLEGLSRVRGRRLPPRKDKQKVSRERMLEIMALDLPIAVGAKLAGVTRSAFARRASSLGGTIAAKARRKAIVRYVYDLRSWVRAEGRIPTFKQIAERHAERLRRDGSELFRDFTPFLPSLKAELKKRPGTIRDLAQRPRGGAVITLAGRVLQGVNADRADRAALAAGPESKPSTRLPRKKHDLSQYLDSAALTERQQKCLSLKLEYEFSISEIARRLAVSRATVQEHIHAGSRRLRYELERKGRAKKQAVFSPGNLKEPPRR